MLKHYFDIIVDLLRIFQKIISGKRGIIRYLGKGTNSLYIQAFLGSTISSNTCSIFDYIKYDDATTDKSSNFSLVRDTQTGTLGYDSTNQRYISNRTANGDSTSFGVRLCSIPYTDCEMSVDFATGSKLNLYNAFMWIGGASEQDWNNHCEIGTWSSSKVCGGVVNGANYRSNPSGALGTNTWYTLYAKFENGSCTTKIINPTNQSVIFEKTFTCFSMETMYIDIDVNGASSTNYFKNIKVISL